MHMMETAELLAFTRTVDAKSLARAARELGIPRATISRRLARLETRLGARLLRRTTRSLVLTDAGEAFYRKARIVLDAVAQAEASVHASGEQLRGDLRVSVPPIVSGFLHELLCRFAARHPAVRLQVHFSSQHVDLHREGFDVALRASQQLEPGLVARTLARVALVAIAAPRYLAEHGTPRGLRDLRGHRCILGFDRGYGPQTTWPLLKGGRVHVDAAMTSNEITFLAYAAMRGDGIAVVPRSLVEPLFAEGALVHVLPTVLGMDAKFSIVYAERELMKPALRAFVDMVALEATTLVAQAAPTFADVLRNAVPKKPKRSRAPRR